MIKATDIKAIYKEKAKIDNMDKPKDIIQELEHNRKVREINDKVFQIDKQLNEIDIEFKDNLYLDLFIDKYINGKKIIQLMYEYNLSRSTLYKKLEKARKVFEGYKNY